MADQPSANAPLADLATIGSVVAYAFSDAGPYEHIDTTNAEVEFTLYFAPHPCDGKPYLVGPTFSYVGAKR